MKRFLKIVTDMVLIVLIAYAAVLYLPAIAKIKPYQVLSGSMEPAYHVGSLVYVRAVEADSVEVGDTITFHLTTDTVVTHRVVDKNETDRTFTTKGDANETADGSKVSYASVIGKVVFSIPLLGYIHSYLSSVPGMIMIGTMLVILFILSVLLDYLSKKEGEFDHETIKQ